MASESQKPSALRIVIAIVVTVLCMAIGWLGASRYVEHKNKDKFYYPVGESGDVPKHIQRLPYGEVTVIGERIHVVSFTERVKPGGMAELEIRGTPYAVYSIEVHLKSGFSSSSALKPKKADADGIVRWEWRIGSRTSLGRFMVSVHREDEQNSSITYAEMYINVVKSDKED